MAGGEEDAQPSPPSVAERRKARRKALIQEHLSVVERTMAGRENARERAALAEVAAGLRRREEELDRAGDADAWAAAHPPKRMPEARVAYYRAVAEGPDDCPGRPNALPLLDEMTDGLHKKLNQVKERAEGLVREYDANGYIEQFDADDFGLPPNYASLLRGM
ncbi:hypothetical protein GQ55_3G071500 [Panicum hallii var. hallii]|uniref:Uncharacterized protein n=1 Tax=Panicum hallii var. hallii TaxID=1504633 RepID=A0A2T7E6N0_9POAL|nr:hypothetical protein GQ55_3G071500 [Panicum hallii var. hallii]